MTGPGHGFCICTSHFAYSVLNEAMLVFVFSLKRGRHILLEVFSLTYPTEVLLAISSSGRVPTVPYN